MPFEIFEPTRKLRRIGFRFGCKFICNKCGDKTETVWLLKRTAKSNPSGYNIETLDRLGNDEDEAIMAIINMPKQLNSMGWCKVGDIISCPKCRSN